jgi:hypothetical protein
MNTCKRGDDCTCPPGRIRDDYCSFYVNPETVFRRLLSAVDGYMVASRGTDAFHELNNARAEAHALLGTTGVKEDGNGR